MKIFLVEDDLNQALATRLALEKIDDRISVFFVTDGMQASRVLLENVPCDEEESVQADKIDLVLLDINLPQMDGITLLKKIKANSHVRHIPVILFSANPFDEAMNRVYAIGAAAYIQKTPSWREFHQILEGAIRHFMLFLQPAN